MSDSLILIGISGSHGVAVGVALVLESGDVLYRRRHIKPDSARAEFDRFVGAVCEVQADLRKLIAEFSEGRPEAAILEAYLLMVGDEMLARRVHHSIHEERRCADWAVARAIKGMAKRLSDLDDPYIRERSHDVQFVGERLLRALSGVEEIEDHLNLDESCIVVARDLSPADTAAMAKEPVLGFVTERGSRTSHTSIMARALEIPAVVGVDDAMGVIESGDQVIVDGLRGIVVVRPKPAQLEEATRRAARYAVLEERLHESRDRLTTTACGVRVGLHANIELAPEAKLAVDHGAEGVGLYRTEFLYVDRSSPPDEEQQLAQFKEVLTTMDGRGVTLRTFDIGGDKFMSSFQLPRELNPMLGLRAVRLQLTEPEILLVHLRAMLRTTAFGSVRIMIPLVSTLDELFAVRRLLERAKEQVREAGHAMAEEVPLGVMIEVPAAAITADLFAREADFMSIGTNDLVQYALAIDRSNRTLAYLASPYHPSVLRMIANVLTAGRVHECPVSLCGEMGSEPYGALLLVGMGLRQLSMESVAIPEIKEALHRVDLADLEDLAQKALAMRTAGEVEQLLNDALEPLLHDLLTGQPASLGPDSLAAISSDRRGAGES